MLYPLVSSLFLTHLCSGVAALPRSISNTTTVPRSTWDGGNDTLRPYEPFNYTGWIPDHFLYSDLPMIQKNVTINGQQLTYQDFNVSALSVEQFKQHFMNLPQFFNEERAFLPTLEEVEAYRGSLVNHELGSDTKIVPPSRLSKRSVPDMCFYDDRLHCSSSCLEFVSRGVRQSFNDNVYGRYHYVSDSQCGTGSITKTVSVSRNSGLHIGGSGNIPGFGKGWTKAFSTFFSAFGLTISHAPDSVTTTIGYSGTCGPFNVCFLWERPHFRVDKGVIVQIDANTKRACTNPVVTPYEAHIMHESGDSGGANSHGLCYSMASHGCGSRVDASSTLQRCPEGY